MGVITKQQKDLIEQCTAMFENYYEKMKGHKGDHSLKISLTDSDKKHWLEEFYPQLMSNDLIIDDRFFYPDGRNKNWGVGNDGIMLISDFCNIMYQLYKTLCCSTCTVSDEDKVIVSCIRMLEPYVEYCVNTTEMSKITTLSTTHMKSWKDEYYPKLVETKKIHDTDFFDSEEKNKNYGIGQDGKFNSTELLHFLYECYKYLYIHYAKTA